MNEIDLANFIDKALGEWENDESDLDSFARHLARRLIMEGIIKEDAA
jgi:hypothetical protein